MTSTTHLPAESRDLSFDEAFAELTAARAEYDRLHGDAEHISELSRAAARLEQARWAVALVRAA